MIPLGRLYSHCCHKTSRVDLGSNDDEVVEPVGLSFPHAVVQMPLKRGEKKKRKEKKSKKGSRSCRDSPGSDSNEDKSDPLTPIFWDL
jgi:hypothetical protein